MKALQLNLQSNSEKAEAAANLPKPEREEHEPDVMWKRLDQIANRAAHKAAEHGLFASRIFSK